MTQQLCLPPADHEDSPHHMEQYDIFVFHPLFVRLDPDSSSTAWCLTAKEPAVRLT